MEALQSLPKRPERPPVYLISEGGVIVGNPSSIQITDEINMTVIAPIRVIYELFMGNPDDELMVNPRAIGAVANTLFSALERWEQLSGYLCKPKKEAKPQSTFDDHRFWEYVAQIKIDGADPADILEAWLKEHNPEFLKDD